MKRKKVYLTCGISGSGKSTWVKQQIKENGGIWHSRDEVRFSMLEDGEDYFSKETAVFNKWVNDIRKSLADETIENIYIDATHISENSRNKVLNRLDLTGVDIIPVVFNIPLKVCLQRNKMRTGRAKVPNTAIKNMYNTFSVNSVSFNEKYHYKEIIYITEKGAPISVKSVSNFRSSFRA